jgi:hypothetical protein
LHAAFILSLQHVLQHYAHGTEAFTILSGSKISTPFVAFRDFVPPQHRPLFLVSSGPNVQGDFYSFDPANTEWIVLSAVEKSFRPCYRENHGFTRERGRLYVHGGYGRQGKY